MKKVKVAQFGLSFNPKNQNKITVFDFDLPEGTEILSVSLEKKSKEAILWITFHAPAEAYNEATKDMYPWRTYSFSIVMCKYTDFEINEHKYIGDVNIYNGVENNTYSIFYEIGATVKN